MIRQPELLDEKIILSPNYRTFLREAFNILRAKRRTYSLAQFSKKSGIASKGFIVDVIKGKKRLSYRSIPKVHIGLGLQGRLKKLFNLLIEVDELDQAQFSNGQPKSTKAHQSLERLRSALLNDLAAVKDPAIIDSDAFYSDYNLLRVYASLGSIEKGASLEQIIQRSGIQRQKLPLLLKKMEELKITIFENGKYRAVNSHIVFEKLSSQSNFQKVYLDSIMRSAENAKTNFENQNQLFFHSIFPLNQDLVPKLRDHLKQALTDFVHDNQCDEGDCVYEIQLAFSNQKGG